MNTLLVGLVGYKRAGKDTVCSMLSELDPLCKRFALADPLKDEVCATFGINREDLDSQKELWRPLLQWWGTEYRQRIQDDQLYWVRKLLHNIEQTPAPLIAVVTDVRFHHEANVIRNLGGLLVRVDAGKDSKDTHASEQNIFSIKCEHTIWNIGSVDDLRVHVNNFYETFLSKISNRLSNVDLTCSSNRYARIESVSSSGERK